MGERSDQITKEIAQTRDELGNNLQELEQKVKSVTDWRSQFHKSPLTMLGIAFGGGILLSRIGGTSSRKHRWDIGEPRRSAAEGNGSVESNGATDSQVKKAGDTWDTIQGALIGVAANKFQTFLGGAIPGFNEEYTKTQQEKKMLPKAGEVPSPAGM